MTITENQRRQLSNRVATVLGEPHADTLMALLPMNDSDNVVREPDLRAAVAELRAESADLRADMVSGFARLEQTIVETNSKTRNWFLTTAAAVAGLVSFAQLLGR